MNTRHTRSQCQEHTPKSGSDPCPQVALPEENAHFSVPPPPLAGGGGEEGQNGSGRGDCGGHALANHSSSPPHLMRSTRKSSLSASPSTFLMPSTSSAQAARRGSSSMACDASTTSEASSSGLTNTSSMMLNPREVNENEDGSKRIVLIVELPAEILVKILKYMSFKEIGDLRFVSRRFNEICASLLNSTFTKFQSLMLSRFHEIKNKMPRRESARRNHPLARESDIVETLHMRLTLLQMTFGKHIERKHICFFPGEILDEVTRIIQYISNTSNLGRAYKVTDEMFDLSSMAMEYFKEKLEPTLPEISYFGADFLDFATPFASPVKGRGRGNTNSPFSSRNSEAGGESVAGSSASEPWFNSNSGMLEDDEIPEQGSNMVLRKRIRSIRKGMKRYNNELVEVKRELKSCKAKMETQTKQVQEYSQRLEDYDKKFEESSRKFQTLLTELNKCKTELQFWRSKSALISTSSSAATSPDVVNGTPLPTLSFVGGPALFTVKMTSSSSSATPTSDADETASLSGMSDASFSQDLKALANQGVFPPIMAATPTSETATPTSEDEEEPSRPGPSSSPRPVTRGSFSGPPSPAVVVATPTNGRGKRKLPPPPSDEAECTRKSLRGQGGKGVSGATPTRNAHKRPKLAN